MIGLLGKKKKGFQRATRAALAYWHLAIRRESACNTEILSGNRKPADVRHPFVGLSSISSGWGRAIENWRPRPIVDQREMSVSGSYPRNVNLKRSCLLRPCSVSACQADFAHRTAGILPDKTDAASAWRSLNSTERAISLPAALTISRACPSFRGERRPSVFRRKSRPPRSELGLQRQVDHCRPSGRFA